jgi:hypothetical protein
MRTLAIAAAFGLAAACLAQTAENVNAQKTSSSEDRLLLPPNFVRGYADFEVAPPHNEVDLGICAPQQGPLLPGGQNCAAYARYIWSGYVEFQPFGRTALKHLFVYTEPKLFGGQNIPQLQYTASASADLLEETVGAGYTLPRRFEVRVTHHRSVLLGRYHGTPNALIYRSDGPYGLYTTVGVRWYFGGYGRADMH